MVTVVGRGHLVYGVAAARSLGFSGCGCGSRCAIGLGPRSQGHPAWSPDSHLPQVQVGLRLQC